MSDEVSHVSGLVLYLVALFAPGSEAGKSLFAHKILARNSSQSVRFCNLVVDERIVEVYLFGILLGVAVDDTLNPCPIER